MCVCACVCRAGLAAARYATWTWLHVCMRLKRSCTQSERNRGPMQRRERCVWYMQEQCLSVLVWCGAVCVFYATVRCRLRHYTKLPWREIKTKDTLEWAAGPQKARQRKKASGKSISQIQTSSDGNTHKSKHKLRGEGAGKTTQVETKHKTNA